MVSAESQAAMDAAKKAVMEFMTKNGRHDTTVHEKVNAAVYHETISRTEKEELVTLVDREIIQDHYHTSVQPITDSETIEEQHHHNLLPIENRFVHHEDEVEVKERLATEIGNFKNEVIHQDSEHTRTVLPNSEAIHVHHHVYEVIQPVVNKHTIEPHVIHTTVRIHEHVHNTSKFHMMSMLPVINLADFKKQGGILTGREERWDSFEGEPRSVGGNVGTQDFNPMSAASSGQHSNNQPAPNPERRASMGPSTQAGPVAPERRSSMAPADRSAAPSTDKSHLAPSSAAGTDTSRPSSSTPQTQPASRPAGVSQGQPMGSQPAPTQPSQPQPGQSQAQPSQPQASQAQAVPGRFSFLPMNLARSAGDSQMGHQPIRAPLRTTGTPAQTTPGATDNRQQSVAQPNQQQPGAQDQQTRRQS